MLVNLDWTELSSEGHALWEASLCLYAYLHPARDWLLYVGKADYSSVRQRLRGDHKLCLFDDIMDTYDIDGVRVLHGEVIPDGCKRRSSALLSDVESLLITRVRPFGNIQCRRSRISRPGMRVHCLGAWPFRRWRFHDID